MRLFQTLISIFIIDLSVDSSLGLVLYPLSNEQLVFRVIKVTSLPLALVAYPVTFKVVTVSFC